MSLGFDTREAQQHWSDKAGSWIDQADAIAAMADSFNRPLLEAIDLRQGHRILDLASGAGEPALTASRQVGPEGLCVASDFVPTMLSGIRQRPGADALLLSAADMQALPFQSRTFDRVSCRFGIMFVPDVPRALSEIGRVLLPGGRVGFLVWGLREEQTIFTVLAKATEDFLGAAHDDHHLAIFRFGDAGSLSAELGAAGFRDIDEQELRFSPRIPSGRPFWQSQLEMSFGHLLGDLNADHLAILHAGIEDGFRPYITDGYYHLKAAVRLVTASRV